MTANTRNDKPLLLEAVPRLSMDDLRHLLVRSTREGRRVVTFFGVSGAAFQRAPEAVELVLVLANDAAGELEVCSASIEGGTFPSLTVDCPELHLFEREIAEQHGVVPRGHPWLKPVRFSRAPIGVMDFYRVEGDEVHEVAVGPVHAGVIEPGHFRFQCHGEQVLHLEISLGYQHRGIEEVLAAGLTKRTLPMIETLAGDTTIGHTTAHCHLLEALSGTRVSARSHTLRAIALELERLANHTGGLGALANDVGFLPTASFCGRLRGDFLNLTAAICGSRFGRALLKPGGVGFDVEPDRAHDMIERLQTAARETRRAVELLWNNASVMARFEGTGVVPAATASALGLVGLTARASGLDRDVRRDHAGGLFRFSQIPVSVSRSGDVFARAYVRWLEIERSSAFVLQHLQALPNGALQVTRAELAPRSLCVSLVEGWRGEIAHVGITDGDGRLIAYKITDPSFHNWSGLAFALRDNAISDFPLCNKSFDLSYCGQDL